MFVFYILYFSICGALCFVGYIQCYGSRPYIFVFLYACPT